MKKESRILWKLFTSTLYLSTFTFGGGYVILPMMEKKFVEDFEWIDEEEMLNLISISQSAPGSMSVHASVLIGYRMAGLIGALVTFTGTIIPPFIIMNLLSYIYGAVRGNLLIGHLLRGMQAGIVAIIVNLIYKMVARILKKKKMIPIATLFLSLAGIFIFNLNIIYLLLFAGTVGAIETSLAVKKEDQKVRKRQEAKR